MYGRMSTQGGRSKRAYRKLCAATAPAAPLDGWRMIRRLLLLVACCVPYAATASDPVYVVVRADQSQKDPNAGLIGSWATMAVNKQSARKVQSFMRVHGTQHFQERSQAAFSCFASSQACSAPPSIMDVERFSRAVRAGSSQEGYVVELLPELVAEQLLIRASAYRVRMPDDGSPLPIKVDRAYHALYTTRAPRSLAARGKSNLAALEAYWSEGEPRRIVTVTNRGLAEINALFAMLIRQEGGGPGEATVNLSQFPDKKRLACKGAGLCALTYLWKDNGDSFVLVHNGNHAGWLDAEAAADESNLPSMASFGVPGTMLPAAP
jgi:hypothetical protein